MPYTVEGRNVLKDGKVIQRCKSHENALAAVRLKQAVEHGWKPTGKRDK